MAKYHCRLNQAEVHALFTARRAAVAEFEPGELEAARARSDAFLDAAERDRRMKSRLCAYDRDIALLTVPTYDI